MGSVQFLESTEKLSWIQQYNQFNEEFNIYRTVVVTNNRMILNYLHDLLQKEDFSVFKTCSGSPAYDYETFLRKLYRIFFITSSELLDSSEDFMKILMDEHNFIILENLNYEETENVMNLLKKAKKTGFLEKHPYYIWIN